MSETKQPGWLRDWLGWLIFVVPFLALLGFLSIWSEVGEPFGGFVSYNRAHLPTGEVDANTPIWWAGLLGDGLQFGDTLIIANDRPFYPDARQVFQEAAVRGDTEVTLLVTRDGAPDPLAVTLPVQFFSAADVIDLRLPDWISSLAFWLLAIIVYAARPAASPNRAFAIVTCIVASSRANYVHSLYMDPDFLTNASETVLLVSSSFAGVALIYFVSQFPYRMRYYARWMPVFLITLGLFISILYLYSRTPFALPSAWPDLALVEGVAQLLAVALLALGLALALLRLVWHIRRENTNQRQRNVLVIMVFGWLAAMPLLGVTVVANLGIFQFTSTYNWGGLDVRYLLLGVALAFAYVLLRYQAFQAPSRLYLFVFVISGSALLAAVGAWLWTLGFETWPENGLRPPFFALFLAAAIAGLFWVSQTSIEGIFGRLLHRERVSYTAARLFGQRVMEQTDLASLPQSITDALMTELQLDRAIFWATRDNELRPVAQSVLSGQAGTVPVLPLPGEGELVGGKPIYVLAEEMLPAWLQPLAAVPQIEIVVPLVADGRFLGLLGLGQRWDEEVFDDRDLEIAEMIGQQATLFIVAAQSVNELRRVPGRMADVQDQERARLAQELHDTIQQFLGRLPFYLAVSRDSYSTDPEKSAELLNRSINDVEHAARSVRQIRHNLAPSQLEGGLSAPLIMLATHFQNRTGLTASLNTDPDVDAMTTLETRHALYRVIQQALDNVEMHAQASNVTIHVYCDNGSVVFSVEDDGRGSTPEERAAAQASGSFGLQSMRARLDSCDGQLLFDSRPGHGTGVGGRVPAVRPVRDGD